MLARLSRRFWTYIRKTIEPKVPTALDHQK
jgi:hypothetical protein